jgi:hypothetical protein
MQNVDRVQICCMGLVAYVRTSNGKGSVDSVDAQADACRE